MHVRQEKKEDMWKIVYEMVKPGRHYHHSSNSSYYPLTKASFCCISDWLVCNYNTRGRGIFADTWQCVSSAVCPNNHIKLQLSDWMRAGLDLCPPTNTWTGQTIISAIKIWVKLYWNNILRFSWSSGGSRRCLNSTFTWTSTPNNKATFKSISCSWRIPAHK